MNETLKTLTSRRSVRAYKPEQITDDELNAVLEAGAYAATGMGKQSPIMVVLQKPDDIKELSKMNAAVMGADVDPFYGAPTVIVVLADKSVGTYVEDGSLVIGNLMNSAYSLGLGSCWIHRAKEEFDSPEGKALLEKWGVKGNYAGIGHCILGYAAAEPKPAAPRKDGYIIKV